MTWTAYPDIDMLLCDLRARMQSILSDRLSGLYLYGSLITGDFDHVFSDIDLLAVVSSALADQDLEALHAMHDTFAVDHPSWYDRIEVAYVSEAALRTFRTRASTIAAISPGEPFHTKEAGREWLMNWWMAREQGVPLFGPPPESFIDLITKDEFLENVRENARLWVESIEDYRELPSQGYAIVTGCRALFAINHSQQTTKKRAVAWAQSRYPEWAGLMGDAFAWMRSDGCPGVDPERVFPETVRFVRFVRQEILGTD